MNMIHKLLALILLLIFIQGCANTLKPAATPTTILLRVESGPSGAQIYAGPRPDKMILLGTTPFNMPYMAVNPYWKESYYQLKKEGYYESEIKHFPQSPVNHNRFVVAVLDKITESKINPTPKAKQEPEISTPPEQRSIQKARIIKTGTGFFVNKQGNIVSNYHVVRGCNNIEIRNVFFKAKAKLLFTDNVNDLAVLITDTIPPPSIGYFRSGKELRMGDDIITIGYPLGSILGESAKATKGNISSMTGIANDSSMLQISAPIQPGSSGGPLLDNSGNIVGIVSSKLSELAMLKATGSLPQNVNFAIKTQAVQLFLDTHKIIYSLQHSDKNYETADIVEKAQEFTLQVRCSE